MIPVLDWSTYATDPEGFTAKLRDRKRHTVRHEAHRAVGYQQRRRRRCLAQSSGRRHPR